MTPTFGKERNGSRTLHRDRRRRRLDTAGRDESVSIDGIHSESICLAEEFLSSGALDEVSCLVLDVQMPGMGGLSLQSISRPLGDTSPSSS